MFDFFDSNELNLFTEYTNTVFDLNKPSMVILKNYNKKKIQENTIYSINRNTVIGWVENNQLETQNDSFLFGYNINLLPSDTEVFNNTVTLDEFNDWQLNYHMHGKGDIKKIPSKVTGKLSVIIRDVGQGNWNEIYVDGIATYIYDAGASMYDTKSQLIIRIGNRAVNYATDKPGLFLSHWDKDHYHALIGMTDAELSNFSFFVCRDQVPNLTSRILFVRLVTAIGINNIYTIQAEQNPPRQRQCKLKEISPKGNQLMIFNAYQHKDRNVSSIVLSIRTSTSSIVLSGDCHYKQISNDILPLLSYPNNHYLVVPHHGGKAGTYIYKLPKQITPIKAIISVGHNYYGHPLTHYKTLLKLDSFKIEETQAVSNDIIINL